MRFGFALLVRRIRFFRLPPFDAEFKYRRKYSTFDFGRSKYSPPFVLDAVEQRETKRKRERGEVPLVEEEDEQKGNIEGNKESHPSCFTFLIPNHC